MFPTFWFSVADLDNADACALNRRWGNLTNVYNRVVLRDESFDINVWWALNTTTPLDVVWSIRMDRTNGNEVARLVALKTARLVYAWFVEHYPDDTQLQPFMEYIEQIAARPDMDVTPQDFDETYLALYKLELRYYDACQWLRRRVSRSLMCIVDCFCRDTSKESSTYAYFAADYADDFESLMPEQIRDYIFELYGIQPT
jgi:hypothetical protein